MGHAMKKEPTRIISEKKWCKAAAKLQVVNLLNAHPGMDQLDIADNMRTSLWFACEVCDELVKEGKIKQKSY
jgi:predicted transcriptional regulator